MPVADAAALPAPSSASTDPAWRWRALSLFGLYHLALGTALLLAQGQDTIIDTLAPADPALFRAVAWLLVAAAPVILIAARLRRPAFALQVHAALFFDVVVLTLLLHAGGGVDSGAGLLLAVSLAIGLPLTNGASAFAFAALASTAVVAEQMLAYALGTVPIGNYLHAGLLGAALFAIALLDYTLSQRVKASEGRLRETEIDLEDLNAVNAFVLGLLDIGVVVVDGHNRVRAVNTQAQRWLGHAAANRLPLPLAALSPELSDYLNLWRAPESNRAGATSVLSTGQGDYRIDFSPLGSGADRAAVVLIHDLGEIRAETHKAQLAALGQLSASITHEIRNPLSAITMAAHLLREDETTDRQQRVSEMILRNSERLNRVIDNVLTLARRQEPAPRALDLGPFVEKVAEQIRANPTCSTATIEVRCLRDALALIDPGHLEQVLNILGENAAKHARKDNLVIEMTVGSGDDGRPFVDVADNGPGISPDSIDGVFEPFFTTGQGTGLGLYLARQFCEANQAHLTLASGEDNGSRFRISMLRAG